MLICSTRLSERYLPEGIWSQNASRNVGYVVFPSETVWQTIEKEPDSHDWIIRSVTLTLRAKVPGIDEATFLENANDAKAVCPVSRVLNADVILDAQLIADH